MKLRLFALFLSVFLLLPLLSACNTGTVTETTDTEASPDVTAEDLTDTVSDPEGETTAEVNASPSVTVTVPKPNQTLTDFPVLVSLDGSCDADAAEVLLSAKEDGSDLTVTLGGVSLAYEIASFSKDEQKVALWVKIPTLSHEADTVLSVAANGEGSVGTVWENGYDLVLHMSSIKEGDSSPKNNPVNAYGNIGTATGAMGNGLLFNGTDAYMTAGTPSALIPESPFTPVNNSYTNTGYAKPTDWNYAQGLTSDGEYFYFAGHFDSKGLGASIHKIRMSDMTEVAVFDHAGPMHSAILDYEPESDTVFASTGGNGRAAAVWELDKTTGDCLGQWNLQSLGYGGGAGVISLGNREILLYTSTEDGAKIAFSHLRLEAQGRYVRLSEWYYTEKDLGVGQGLDSLSRNTDGSFTVYYLADAGSSVSVDPHYIYKIRLIPGEALEVEERYHISIKEETEGLTFSLRSDGKYDVYFGSNAERIYKLDGTLDTLAATPMKQPISGNAFTLSFFVKVNSTPNKYPGILGYGALNGNKNRFSLHLFGESEGKLRFGTCLSDTWTKLDTDNGVLKYGTFYHIAAVYDGSEMRLHIDGTLYRSMNVSGTLTDYGALFSLGADIENGVAAYFFHGVIDEVRLSSEVRSEAWIAAEAAQRN